MCILKRKKQRSNSNVAFFLILWLIMLGNQTLRKDNIINDWILDKKIANYTYIVIYWQLT